MCVISSLDFRFLLPDDSNPKLSVCRLSATKKLNLFSIRLPSDGASSAMALVTEGGADLTIRNWLNVNNATTNKGLRSLALSLVDSLPAQIFLTFEDGKSREK